MCDGVSRRGFLRIGAIGAMGLSLADLLRLSAQGAVDPRAGQKAVIMVYLQGGPPHSDMYDLKPGAPAEYRGEFSPISTTVPGMDLCELMPRQASIAQHLAIVRSMKFQANGHAPPELMTGSLRKDHPAFGSFVSRLHSDAGRLGAMPPYASLDRFVYPSFLGEAHKPFIPGEKTEGLSLDQAMTLDRLEDRKNLLQGFDRLRREMDNARGSMAGMDAFTRQALEMITSSKARDALDVSLEPRETREKYGSLTDLLKARRLVEAGVSVVDLTIRCDDLKDRSNCRSDWDFHDANFAGCRTMLPQYDQAVWALVSDLVERGLDRYVAVVVWGEMGRTPQINAKAGRDHWPQAGFALFAGGGLKMGQVIGATDARAAEPITHAYTPQNVLATLYHVLGINPGATTVPDLRGRPIYLLENPRRIDELV